MPLIHDRRECLTGCQDHAPWSPRTDLRVDFVMVYGADASMPDRVREYREHGYVVHLMTGCVWGDYQDYLDGGDEYAADDDLYGYDGYQQPAAQPAPSARPAAGASVNLSGSALEMKLVKPERYDTTTVQKIADHLISGRTVVLNLESTNKEAARRLIDFLSGVVYTIEGDITRVSPNTVVIVPKNVHVSGEQLQEQMKKTEPMDDLI